MIELTDDTFFDQIPDNGLALVQFSAPWCGPCRFMSPRLQELEDEGLFAYFKINIDEHPNAAKLFNIMSIPTIQVYKDNQLVKTFVGAKTRPEILKQLEGL